MSILRIRSDDPHGYVHQINNIPIRFNLIPKIASKTNSPNWINVPEKTWKNFQLTFVNAIISQTGLDTFLQSNWNQKERQNKLRTVKEIDQEFPGKQGRFGVCWPILFDKSNENALYTVNNRGAEQAIRTLKKLAEEIGFVFELEIEVKETMLSAENRQIQDADSFVPSEPTPESIEESDSAVAENTDGYAELGMPRNLIVFGAPGTGKTYYLEELRKKSESILGGCERVTFHPDYTYANFVGTYKPVPKEDGGITYKFVPGPFLRLLVKAIKDRLHPYLLIVEEINRAEPAAVFGDVFQLLDRDKDHKSEYGISPSEDMKVYLREEGINDTSLALPENFYLWATMNSADQGVFPMDTAFKRRWDFKYIGIDENAPKPSSEDIIKLKETQKFYWNDVREKINDRLAEYKINEDKQLGPFFFKLPKSETGVDPELFKELFKNKVLMYLFEDAAKQKRSVMFEGCRDKTRFSKICEEFDQIGLKIFGEEFCKDVCKSDEELLQEQTAYDEYSEQTEGKREEALVEA